MNRKNAEIKAKAIPNGVKMWEIALRCNISENTLYRRMRTELSHADYELFLRVIDEIAAERKHSNK